MDRGEDQTWPTSNLQKKILNNKKLIFIIMEIITGILLISQT